MNVSIYFVVFGIIGLAGGFYLIYREQRLMLDILSANIDEAEIDLLKDIVKVNDELIQTKAGQKLLRMLNEREKMIIKLYCSRMADSIVSPILKELDSQLSPQEGVEGNDKVRSYKDEDIAMLYRFLKSQDLKDNLSEYQFTARPILLIGDYIDIFHIKRIIKYFRRNKKKDK